MRSVNCVSERVPADQLPESIAWAATELRLLDADGTLDPTYAPNVINGTVLALANNMAWR